MPSQRCAHVRGHIAEGGQSSGGGPTQPQDRSLREALALDAGVDERGGADRYQLDFAGICRAAHRMSLTHRHHLKGAVLRRKIQINVA